MKFPNWCDIIGIILLEMDSMSLKREDVYEQSSILTAG